MKRKRAQTRPSSRGLPDDLADAAVDALDDLLTGSHVLEDADADDLALDVEIESATVPPRPPRPAPRTARGRAATPGPVGRKTPPPPTRPSAPPARRVPPPPPGPSGRAPTYLASDAAAAPSPAPAEVSAGRPASYLDYEVSARAATSAPLDEQQLVEERVLAEVPVLRVAALEEAGALTTLQTAVLATGHSLAAAASGRDGVRRVLDTLRDGSLDVVFVCLPGGEPVIDAALALEPRRPVIIAIVDGSPLDAIQRASAAGADLVTSRPHTVVALAPLLLAAGRVGTERQIAINARAAEELLRSRLEDLSDPDPRCLIPPELFQRTLELEIKRAKRFEYPLSVALFAVDVPPPAPPPGILGILRARAGNALVHTIRDIDIATQIDHERFLILAPYTDLKGAGKLARRVISSVAAVDAVVSAGRSFPSRVVGAVAGAPVGQPISFSKLLKDASRALEQARKDGADLAVQP